ncbi:hypothetical protein L9F63_018907 [Diploptera punctata]|uniref:Uncharacterized protein n=1 Tax=Diploptera punctata TaxID=6984 RepID=A0AAD7ZVY3_DIPPU|nr:hypothetical protein L9F63_018907 [Diploptera punctata]
MAVPKGSDSGGAKDQLMEKKVEMVPPDGGWGWVVVFAFALSNFSYNQTIGTRYQLDCQKSHNNNLQVIIVPIIQSFGLLFRGRFDQLELSGTDASVIINVNSSFGMMLAIGFNLLTSSFNLALNSYFKEKRSKAVGFATTAMGLGPVLMPLFISVLMGLYGTSGTAFLLGGLALHSLVAALLLQPIKWHMKPKQLSPEELEEANESEDILHDTGTQNACSFGITHDTPRYNKPVNTSHMEELPAKQRPADVNWWTSAASINSVNLGSSVRIFDEKSYQPLQDFDSKNGIRKEGSKKNINEDDSKNSINFGYGRCQWHRKEECKWKVSYKRQIKQ